MEEQPSTSNDNTPYSACDSETSDVEDDSFIELERPSSPVLRVLSPELVIDKSGVSSPNCAETNDCAYGLSGLSVFGTVPDEGEIGVSTDVMCDAETLISVRSTVSVTYFNPTVNESDGVEHSEDGPSLPRILPVHSPKVSFDSTNLFSVRDSNTQCNTASLWISPTGDRPEISFDPTGLILKSHPQERNDEMNSALPKSSFDLDVSSENTHPAGRSKVVTFESSSQLERISSSRSVDDSSESVPAENTKTLDSVDQHTLPSNLSVDDGFQGADESISLRSNAGLHSILKHQKPMSSIEKIVAQCLQLLCGSDDKYEARERIRSSIDEVFKGLCFDQFFRKGECFSSNCDDNHNYKTHTFSHSEEELWNASLYVIGHAVLPNRQIVENLVQHYTAKKDTVRILLFTKCIAKVREADRLELAHFIVNKLSSTIPMRDVITVILMLNFSALPYKRYNMLMEGLRVFKQNTTDYFELMTFLNFQKYQMPASFLVKLMKDSIECPGKGGMLESISGFLRRLQPCQKDEVQPTINDFQKHFGVLPENYNEPPNDASRIQKKKVKFAADVNEVEIVDYCSEADDEVDRPGAVFSDEDNEDADDAAPAKPNFYDMPVLLADRIALVFGGSCGTWMLNGQCSNTDCTSAHDFSKDSLASLSSEDVFLATDFILTQSVRPSFEILKIFIEFLAESRSVTKILKLRDLTLNLSYQDSVKLTKLVISSLEKHIGRWEAIEKVLVPNSVELSDREDGQQFCFDEELLCSVMSEAVESKTSVLRSVTKVIWNLALNLLPFKNADIRQTINRYIAKFMMTEREPPPPLDIPYVRIEPNSFVSHLKVALYQGAPNKYFLATLMMKQAVNGSLQHQTLDVLDTFLLSHYDRARILTQLLENCNYFNAGTRRSVAELFGTVTLKTGIRLYEKEDFAGTAELFAVLRNFKLNIFTLPESQKITTEFNLAIIYCSVTADSAHRSDTIEIFFNRVVDPYLQSPSHICPPELIRLTAKMFRVFTSALLVKESLELYKGIIHRQKSMISPINIAEFVEATFRCGFHQMMDDSVRKEILRLYLDVIECEHPITFQKVTHRSMFLTSLKELTFASLMSREKGHVNLFHPLIKKMLFRCIKEGVYHDMKTLRPTMYSSMTAEEMKIYLLWWFALYVRGRKRLAINYFSPLTIIIIQEFIQDDSRLPVHPSLRSVPTSIAECTERLASVIKNIIGEPLPRMPRRRGMVELHPITVRALSQTALNLMVQHGHIKAESERLCTACFDKLSVDLGKSL